MRLMRIDCLGGGWVGLVPRGSRSWWAGSGGQLMRPGRAASPGAVGVQVTRATERRLAKQVLKASAHGQRWGRWRVRLRAERVIRPGMVRW
jgi:hypothetical protein